MGWTSKETTQLAVGIWAVLAALTIGAWQTVAAPGWLWLAAFVWLKLALVALLMQAEAARRAFLVGTLRHKRYTQIYLAIARPMNLWLWRRLGRMEAGPDGTPRPPPETARLRNLLRAALTWRVVNLALLLAVAYPVLALIRPWLMGGDAVLGAGVVVFPATDFWPDRAMVLLQFAILTLGFIGKTLASASPRRFWRSAADWLPALAFAPVVAFAVSDQVAFAGAFAGAGGFALTIALALASAGAGAGAGASAIAVTGTVAGTAAGAAAGAAAAAGAGAFAALALAAGAVVALAAIAVLLKRGRPGLASVLLALGWVVGLAAVVQLVDVATLRPYQKALIAFIAVLPLINGLFDSLSYAATLATMRKGLATRWALLLGLLDLGIGAVLFLGLGASMVAVIAALNALGSAPLFDLAALFAGLRSSPGDYWWLYLILFSTLLPTGLHLCVAVLAVQGVVLFQGPRRRIAGWVEASDTSPLAAVAGFMAQATLWWLPLMALAGLGWGLWQGIDSFAARVGLIYLDALQALAAWIGAL